MRAETGLHHFSHHLILPSPHRCNLFKLQRILGTPGSKQPLTSSYQCCGCLFIVSPDSLSTGESPGAAGDSQGA